MFCGIDEERLCLKWVSSAESLEFVAEIKDFIQQLKKMGPSPLYTPNMAVIEQKSD